MYFIGRRLSIGFFVTLCLMFISGALLIQVCATPGAELASLSGPAQDQETVVTGHVIREGAVRQKDAEDVQKIDLGIDEITLANITTKTPARFTTHGIQ